MSAAAGGAGEDAGEVTVTEKACTKCGKTKLLEDFYAQTGCSFGRSAYCKACKLLPWQGDLPDERYCAPCQTTKPLQAFSKSRHAVFGHSSICKPCTRAKARHTRYGVDSTDWAAMYSAQDGKCGVCSTAIGRDAATDHHHSTGRVRGLLCRVCNVRAGVLELFARNPGPTARFVEFLLPHEPDPSVRIVLEALKAAGEAQAKVESDAQPRKHSRKPRKPSRLELFRAA